MRRCALPSPLDLDQIILSDEARRYLSASLRLRSGDQFIGFDGEGHERVFELSLDESSGAMVALGMGKSYQGRGGAPVGLCFALPKGDKLDLVARQITELGISDLYLWTAERSVGLWKSGKIDSKLSRLNRVISEAARQSGRADQLQVTAPSSLRNLITTLSHVPLRIFFDPQAELGWPELEMLKVGGDSPISTNELQCVVIVGPEGGLSETEINVLKTAGWRGVRLKSPILRTETAGLVACAIALDRLGYLA